MARLNRSGPGMGLRDRRSAGGGVLSGFGRYIKRTYNGLSRSDRILLWLTLGLVTANLFIFGVTSEEEVETSSKGESTFSAVTGHLRGVKDKWDRLFIPPTPAPTMAPTEARIEESSADVAKKIASFDWGVPKFEKPPECTADVIAKVKSSGMDGGGCSGHPFSQQCKQTILTKNVDNTWLDGFIDEVKELRKDGKGGGAQKATFVAVLLNHDCSKLAEALRMPKDVPGELTKWPWLWCSEPYEHAESTKWGKVGESISGSNMDKKMISRDLREAIKDVVIAEGGDEAAPMFLGGVKTLARTRYVQFEIDWKGSWDNQNIKDAVDKMDSLGHTCYWSGQGKLWRVTGCWQESYAFKTWSHMACSHRVLAPKLAERMEGVFKKTIGM